MNIRRFILRVAVGLLAFLLGVAVAWAIGGLNPFQSSSGESPYSKPCPHRHRSWSSTSGETFLHPETDGRRLNHEERHYRVRRMFDTPPMPPPPPMAPAD